MTGAVRARLVRLRYGGLSEFATVPSESMFDALWRARDGAVRPWNFSNSRDRLRPMLTLSVRTLSSLTALFAFGVLLGCNPGEADDETGCQAGTELCECLGGTTCTGNLECTNGFCVAPGTDEESTDDGPDDNDTDAETDGPDTDAETDAETDVDAETDTGGMEDGGPMIVDFGTNVSMITEGETVIFTATVIDPDGPDDIQGGSLKNEDGSSNFGAFNDNGNGTFSIELTWADISQTELLQFDGSESRTFRAEFFDNMGKMAWQTTNISFTCDGGCAWDGHCPDTQTDDAHCGTCGHECIISDFGGDGHCEAGQCGAILSECALSVNPPQSCSTVCANQGLTCAGAVCGSGDVLLFAWHMAYPNNVEACQDLDTQEGIAYAEAPCTYPNAALGIVGQTQYRCCCSQP